VSYFDRGPLSEREQRFALQEAGKRAGWDDPENGHLQRSLIPANDSWRHYHRRFPFSDRTAARCVPLWSSRPTRSTLVCRLGLAGCGQYRFAFIRALNPADFRPNALRILSTSLRPRHSPVPAEPMVTCRQKLRIQQMSQARKLTRGSWRARSAMRSSFVHVVISSSVPGIRVSVPLHSTANPFEWNSVSSPGIAPTTPLLRVGPTATPPYFLLASSACWKLRFGSGMALPSSDANRWMTCHGLRPRHAATHSPIRASRCWLPGE